MTPEKSSILVKDVYILHTVATAPVVGRKSRDASRTSALEEVFHVSSSFYGTLGVIGDPLCVPRSHDMTNNPHSHQDADFHFGSIFRSVPEIEDLPLTTRLLGQDIPAAKKIAAQYLPGIPPTTRIELLARSLGYRTAASFQSGFKAVPATPEVTATPLVAADHEGPAFNLLAGLSEKDQQKAAGLGAHVIGKILQNRFRVSASAPNKMPQISTTTLYRLGPLAAGTLAARRVIAEALLGHFALSPLVIREDDIREAWLSSGASAAPPRVTGVAAALLLAIDLGLDAQAIADLDARQIKEGRIPLGTRVHASAGQNARTALESWIGPFDRSDAAITPARLHGSDAHTAIEEGLRCDPDSLDALVFAATGSKKVGLGSLTLRDAAVASHLILCAWFGKSVSNAVRRLGVPEWAFRAALKALGGAQGTRQRDQAVAKHLGIKETSARRRSDAIGAILEKGESALDIFMETVELAAAKRRDQSKELERAPLVFGFEKASEAVELIATAKLDTKASGDHVARYFKTRGWSFDFTPSILGRPRNPVNTVAREVLEVAWDEGDISKDGSTIVVDWFDTHPIGDRRRLLLDGPVRIDVYGDNSACVLVKADPGSALNPNLPGDDKEMTRRAYEAARMSGLWTRLLTECLPFPVSVRGTVTCPGGDKAKLGEKGLVDALMTSSKPSAGSDTDRVTYIETAEGRAALRRQLEREIEALHDYAAGRTLALQAETALTACREEDWKATRLPWNEPYHANQSIRVSGHKLRLRWRLGDDPAHAHFSRDPYSRAERDWVQEALDLAVTATVGQFGVKVDDLEAAVTAPNLATGAPAGVMFLGHPLASYFAEMDDPSAPDRIKRAKASLLERLAPVCKRLRKRGFVFGFGREIMPLKLARSGRKIVPGDPKILDRRLTAHLDRYPDGSTLPGAE